MFRYKKVLLFFLLVVIGCCSVKTVYAEEQIIRIGFSNEDETFLEEAQAEKSYANQFMQTLFGAMNTNKDYSFEFTCGPRSKMEEELLMGNIDILIAAPHVYDWNGEDRYVYDFENALQVNGKYASEWVAIFVPDRSNINYDDSDSLQNSVIGVLERDLHRQLLNNYLEEKDINVNIKVYSQQDDMEDALRNGDVDAIVSDTNRSSFRRISMYLGHSETYLYTSAEREDFWLKLNRAYNRVIQENHDFISELNGKCYTNVTYLSYTQEQIDYMFQSEALIVAYPVNRSPDIYQDSDGNMAGTFAEYARLIDKKSPLAFDYLPKANLAECFEAVKTGEADMVLGSYNVELYMQENDLMATIPFTKSLFAIVGSYDVQLDEPLRVGYREYVSMEHMMDIISYTFPHWTQVRLENGTKTVRSIEEGVIDVAVVSNDYARHLMYQTKQEIGPLYVFDSDQEISLVLSNKDGNEILKDILDQSILRITDEEIRDIEARQTTTIVRTMTLQEMAWYYRWPIMFLVFFLCLISLAVFFVRKNKKKSAENRYQSMSQMLELQCQHYQELKDYQEAIRTYRHDLKNHNMIISACLEKGDVDGLKSYLSDMSGDLPNLSLVDTGNPVLDAILSDRFAKARKLGIQLDTEINIPPGIKMEPMDVNRIFSNCLDNAIESCQRVQKRSGEPAFIRIKIKEKRGYLLFQMENSTLQVIRTAEGGPITWKSGTEHGLGLGSVKTVIQKYNGYFEERDNDGVFYTEWTIGDVWEE